MSVRGGHLLILTLIPLGPAFAHPLLMDCIQHRTSVAVGPENIDITVELTFFELPSLAERRQMDADHDGVITLGEQRAYCERLTDALADAVSVTCANVPLSRSPAVAFTSAIPQLALAGASGSEGPLPDGRGSDRGEDAAPTSKRGEDAAPTRDGRYGARPLQQTLEVIPLYTPEVDLLGVRQIAPSHHVLRVFLFARTPSLATGSAAIELTDRLWPGARAIGTVEARGQGGVTAGVETTESAPAAGAGEGRILRIRCTWPASIAMGGHGIANQAASTAISHTPVAGSDAAPAVRLHQQRRHDAAWMVASVAGAVTALTLITYLVRCHFRREDEHVTVAHADRTHLGRHDDPGCGCDSGGAGPRGRGGGGHDRRTDPQSPLSL